MLLSFSVTSSLSPTHHLAFVGERQKQPFWMAFWGNFKSRKLRKPANRALEILQHVCKSSLWTTEESPKFKILWSIEESGETWNRRGNLPFRVVWCDIEERRAKESIKRMWYVTSQNCKTMPREIIKSKLTRYATSYGKELPLSSHYSSPQILASRRPEKLRRQHFCFLRICWGNLLRSRTWSSLGQQKNLPWNSPVGKNGPWRKTHGCDYVNLPKLSVSKCWTSTVIFFPIFVDASEVISICKWIGTIGPHSVMFEELLIIVPRPSGLTRYGGLKIHKITVWWTWPVWQWSKYIREHFIQRSKWRIHCENQTFEVKYLED